MQALLYIMAFTVITAVLLRALGAVGYGIEIEDWPSALGVGLFITVAGWATRSFLGIGPGSGYLLISLVFLFALNTSMFALGTFMLPGARTSFFGSLLAGVLLTVFDYAGPFIINAISPGVYDFLMSPRVIVGYPR